VVVGGVGGSVGVGWVIGCEGGRVVVGGWVGGCGWVSGCAVGGWVGGWVVWLEWRVGGWEDGWGWGEVKDGAWVGRWAGGWEAGEGEGGQEGGTHTHTDSSTITYFVYAVEWCCRKFHRTTTRINPALGGAADPHNHTIHNQ
jgi:hypothetical protein